VARSVWSDGVTLYVAGSGFNVQTGRNEALLWTRPVLSCPADLDGNRTVDGGDLGSLLLDWGPCTGPPACAADLTDDGMVDGQDLGELLLAWGECGA